jgi:cytochrome c oxidase subunit III
VSGRGQLAQPPGPPGWLPSPARRRGGVPEPADEQTAWVGMLVFLGSWAMLFVSLLFAYGALRLRLPSWPPPGAPRLPVGLALWGTLAILASSATLERWRRAAAAGPPVRPRPELLSATLRLGLGFLGVQGVLWGSLAAKGVRFAGGTLGAVVFGLVAFHAAHVLVGLGGLASLWWSARSGRTGAGLATRRRLWTAFWHLVGAAWVSICLFVFVL